MIDTVGEARNLLQSKAKFGDEESILARDVLRLAEDLDGLELMCRCCGGTGVREVSYYTDYEEDEYVEDDEDYCNQCSAGMVQIIVEDFTTRVQLFEWQRWAEEDGLL